MISFASYNVRGLGDGQKCAKIFSYLKGKHYDIILLQETHSHKKCEKIWKSQWGSQVFYAHGESNARGVAIIIKKHVKTIVHRQIADPAGRFIILDITVNNIRMTIVNLYAPNEDSPLFFQEIFAKIFSFGNDKILIGGEFNTILGPLDKRGGTNKPGHPKCMKFLNDTLKAQNMLDIWRQGHPRHLGLLGIESYQIGSK